MFERTKSDKANDLTIRSLSHTPLNMDKGQISVDKRQFFFIKLLRLE